MTVDVHSRVRGCLLGGAIGDALGGPLEFKTGTQIRAEHGDRLETFATAYAGPGSITDDTQMSLFTAEGMIRTHVGSILGDGEGMLPILHHAYMRWLATQGYRIESYPDRGGLDSGWLVGERFLHSPRAPGNTCLSALMDERPLGELADNDSKGCGGVMRVAPLGLAIGDSELSYGLGVLSAALTHGHPSGSLAAGHLAAVIHGLREGMELPDAIDIATSYLRGRDDAGEVLTAVTRAVELAEDGPSSESVAGLGRGWVAEEALAIALYCALVAEDYLHGMNLAIIHDGDSDSTGAITGNILGTLWGVDALPPDLHAGVEGSAAITRLADDLHDGLIAGTKSAEQLVVDYPGF